MINLELLVNRYYNRDGIMEEIITGLNVAGKNLKTLTANDLAPVDEFHIRGREATIEVADLANIKASDTILDVGCGLGGTARFLAEKYQCKVIGIDLTEEYITVGNKLSELVGLSDRVLLFQGSALDIPYEDETFEIVWTEHVQMNIADKKLFYTMLARVLRPGGQLLFHDVFRGCGSSPIYPLPWAENDSMSILVTESEARSAITETGLEVTHWNVTVQQSIEFFKKLLLRIGRHGLPPMGSHLLMGDNAQVKLNNCLLNLTEDRLSVVLGMAQKN
jgi:MPBQ/MSBQ methyltransferase